MSPFISWIDAPRADRGVHVADDAGGWRHAAWSELAAAARRVAARLAEAGVRPGDVVCVVMPSGHPCLAAVFGTWAAGATVSPLVPPSFQPEQEYLAHIGAVLGQAEPALVVTAAEFEPIVAKAMAEADRPGRPWVMPDDWRSPGGDGLPQVRPGGPIALLQFTSGSTGEPRGVRVSWRNLAANLALIKHITTWREGDAFASWLPLYHDMGLIGGLFFMAATQGDLWLMRPDQFIRDPGRWLGCFDAGRATITASPSFAYGYLTRRLRPEPLEGLDLSRWRIAVVGAEAVDAAALEGFARFAEGTGFSRATFRPAYGLAENTLAVTAPPPGRVARVIRPDWESLRFGEPVRVLESAVLGEAPLPPGSGWLVGHGLPPHPPAGGEPLGVRVVGEDGEPLPDGCLGELVVTGTSVAEGYHGGREGSSTRFADGALHTGDSGFVHDGELYVLGRMGDSIKLRGRTVYVEDLDAKVAAGTGLGRGRVAVVGTTERGRAGVAVFAEADPGGWAEDAHQMLRELLGPEPVITVVAGPRGLIRRTSSGKIRRRLMWQGLRAGRLEGAAVVARTDRPG
ncbi:AMP-binding protein [Thermomonospora amylolytica]|uniref:AMP-binding protein n=1 Tax=Thermomonospora amylolytica TaxID=1411117 RepID=UPI000E6B5A53|nr:AMP-binding protein [Thermomonospora amylolytica]